MTARVYIGDDLLACECHLHHVLAEIGALEFQRNDIEERLGLLRMREMCLEGWADLIRAERRLNLGVGDENGQSPG